MLRAKVGPEARKELEAALKKADQPKWYRRLKVIDLSAHGYSSPTIGQLLVDLLEQWRVPRSLGSLLTLVLILLGGDDGKIARILE